MTSRHDIRRPAREMTTAELYGWLIGLALLFLLCLGVAGYIISNPPPAHRRIQQISGSHWQAPVRPTAAQAKLGQFLPGE